MTDKDNKDKNNPSSIDGQGQTPSTKSPTNDIVTIDSANNVEIFAKPNPVIMARCETLTAKEHLYSNALFANAETNLRVGVAQQSIDLRQFRFLTGYKHKDYRELKRTLDSLVTKPIEFGALDKEMPNFGTTTWISYYEVKNGILYYEYSTKMKDQLISLIQSNDKIGYSKVDLLIQQKLSGKHTLVLYELAKRFVNVRSTGFKSVKWWREMFRLNDSKYPEWADFRRYVLESAIKDINKNSELILNYETHGYPIAEFRVTIQINPDYKNPIQEQNTLDENLSENDGDLNKELKLDAVIDSLVRDYGLSEAKVRTILSNEKYNDNHALFIEVYSHLEKKRKAGMITKSLNGYAFTTFRDYQRPKLPKSTPQITEERQKRAEQKENQDKEVHDQFINKLTTYYLTQSEQTQETITNEYIRFLSKLVAESSSPAFLMVILNLVKMNGFLADTSKEAYRYLYQFCQAYLPDLQNAKETKEIG
jgi:plasmid replication initiation protein